MSGYGIFCAVVTALVLAGLAWMEIQKRRDERALSDKAERVVRDAVDRAIDAVITVADAIVRQAEFDANLCRLDGVAVLYPLPKRLATGGRWQPTFPDLQENQ